MSNSWGSYTKPDSQDPAVFLEAAISKAGNTRRDLRSRGGGNDGVNIDVQPFYPVAYALNNIISVGASDEDDKVSFFNFASNYGVKGVNLFAPGNYIASTYPDGLYAYMHGTSMAAPFVSGAAALVWSQNQAASFSTIKSLILNNVDKKRAFSKKCATGGRFNLYNALKAATP